MRNVWSIIRYLLLGVMFAVVALLGILSFHIVYPIESWWRERKYSFGWFFLDESEPDLISNLYGDQGWRDANDIEIEDMTGVWGWFQRSYVAFRWMALRNPSWNFKLLVAPKVGRYEDVQEIINEGEGGVLTFRNHTKFGRQFVFFTVNGVRYFRFSISKHVKLLWIWDRHWIVQLGTSEVRYVYKNKWSKR